MYKYLTNCVEAKGQDIQDMWDAYSDYMSNNAEYKEEEY